MLRPKRNDRPILLNLPKEILEEVDLAVREQGVSRSQFLRQAEFPTGRAIAFDRCGRQEADQAALTG